MDQINVRHVEDERLVLKSKNTKLIKEYAKLSAYQKRIKKDKGSFQKNQSKTNSLKSEIILINLDDDGGKEVKNIAGKKILIKG